MTYSTSVNGIVITADPAVAQTVGPSGAAIQFTSRAGTAASLPIKIRFSTPIKTFGVTVVGQTNPNHRLEAYDMGGRFIGQVFGTPAVPDMGKKGSDVTLSISGNPSAWIAWIMLIPPTSDYVGYKNIVIVPKDSTTGDPTEVDLAKLVVVDTSTINRTYELGSMKAVESKLVNIRNISTNTPIQVDLTESPDVIGMSFSPANFPLPPMSSKNITVTFNPVELNTNSVSDILSQIVIDLSIAGDTPPDTPEPPTQMGWFEERFKGSPLQPWPPGKVIGSLPTYEQLFSNPTMTQTVPTINYFNTLTAPVTVRWTQNITVTELSNYTFTMVTDDGMRFYINDVITMNEWRDQDDLTKNKTVRLSPGTYTFRVEYFNNGGGSTAKFGYTSSSITLPPSLQETDWTEERFKGSPLQPWPPGKIIGSLPTYEQLFSNPTSTRNITDISYSNTLTAPITLRWIKTITLSENYEFSFRLITDDGMRFYINDTLTMNEWRDQDDLTRTKNVILSPGTYTFRVEYFNNGGGSTAIFQYTPTLILQ